MGGWGEGAAGRKRVGPLRFCPLLRLSDGVDGPNRHSKPMRRQCPWAYAPGEQLAGGWQRQPQSYQSRRLLDHARIIASMFSKIGRNGS